MTKKAFAFSNASQQQQQQVLIMKDDGDTHKPKLHHSTARAIQVEVEDLLRDRGGSCTIEAMASALALSNKVRNHYAKQRPESSRTWGQRIENLRRQLSSSLQLKRRYVLTIIFSEIGNQVGATTTMITSWEQAQEILATKLDFPSTMPTTSPNNAAASSSLDDKVDSVARDLKKAILIPFQDDEFSAELKPSEQKWKQITAVRLPSKLGQRKEDEKDTFTKEVETEYVKYEESKKSQVVIEVEKRMVEKEKEEEAKKMASSLLRDFTDEEEDVVHDAIWGDGPSNEVLQSEGPDSVQRASMQKLRPGQWLNDEVIHYFCVMLGKRDEELCQDDPNRKRSHFFKSFFMTKLLNEGNPAMEGQYEYRNVKRWSKKVPGKDIFNLDKIFFPINQGRMHWVCAVAFMQEKRIQ